MGTGRTGLADRCWQRELFFYLLLLTFIFILTEISYALMHSKFYFADFRLVARHLQIPFRVLPGIFGFLAAELVVHLCFALLVFGFAICTGRVLRLLPGQVVRFSFLLWFDMLLLVLLANAFFFPNSHFAGFFETFLSHPWLLLLMGICSILPCVTLTFSAWYILSVLYAGVVKHHAVAVFLILGLSLSFILFLLSGNFGKNLPVSGLQQNRPNIILVGIDSLRPDFLGFSGSDLKTPHLDRFLQKSVFFPETLTPLARTYPSWVSILTGLYPVRSGIRTNLLDTSKHDFGDTLPSILQRAGYHTIFATDESRFSNIDHRYGFDQVVTPPQGFNDFLLGSVNDFPLSNLLVNTALGQWLFPWSYGNRAAYALYQPDTFLTWLKHAFQVQGDRPVFLAVHLCLPHFPYVWNSLPLNGKVSLHHYHSAIERVDGQFADLMHLLQKNHFLDHAVVILLSDHGEAVEIPGDRITDPDLYVSKIPKMAMIPKFYPPSAANEEMDMSGGHGTDVLGLPQYHSVMAFRTFGVAPFQPGMVTGMTSLLDIRATVLDYLKIAAHSDGVSLLSLMTAQGARQVQDRDLYLESDFSPEAVRSVHPEEKRVLFEGINYFRIDPVTTHIVVKDSMFKLILSSKQFADYRGKWALAFYPGQNNTMTPVLVNLETGKWTTDLSTSFAKQSPMQSMLRRMRGFFGEDFSG